MLRLRKVVRGCETLQLSSRTKRARKRHPQEYADDRYEGMLRLFKDRRKRAGEHLWDKPHGHGLIDEAEAEMHTLSWPELMAAGGVAGVVAWVVSCCMSTLTAGNVPL